MKDAPEMSQENYIVCEEEKRIQDIQENCNFISSCVKLETPYHSMQQRVELGPQPVELMLSG